tara:strand:+ start:388 stop:696 length:309 start_codon:yes stop_codon:yes gene_type:complete
MFDVFGRLAEFSEACGEACQWDRLEQSRLTEQAWEQELSDRLDIAQSDAENNEAFWRGIRASSDSAQRRMKASAEEAKQKAEGKAARKAAAAGRRALKALRA